MRGARLFSIFVAIGATMLTGGAASAAGHLVRITSTLEPATITIAPGDQVSWRNDDNQRHRIRTTSGPREFDSGNLEPRQTFGVTLTKVGRYEYYDHRNDELTRYYGTIIVRDGAGSNPEDPPDPDQPDQSAQPGSPTRATIAIGDRVFRPRSVTIAAGGSITWRNDDDREHTATASNGGFDSGVLSPGESARESFPTPGTFSFLCLIHPEMTGTVTVTGSGGGAPAPVPTPKPTSKPATKPDPGAAANAVAIRDFEFAPTELTVDEGARVTFANRGSAGHTVTSEDGSFDSGLIGPGASWEHTFATSGTFAFICAFHPQMAAVIRVRDREGAPPVAESPAPTSQTTESPVPSSSDPSSSAAATEPAFGGAAGPPGAASSAGVGSAPTSRDIGAVLIGIAVGGGFLLMAGGGIAAVRASRGSGAQRREAGEAGR